MNGLAAREQIGHDATQRVKTKPRFDLPAQAVSVILSGVLLAVVAGQELCAAAPDVRQSWEDDYASLRAALSNRANPYALLRTGEERKDVAHNQSLIWESDRTPVDVVLRRTEALLQHLKDLPKAPDLGALEMQWAAARSRNTEAADDKELYLAVRMIGRAAVLANPLLDFDALIFNRWSSRYGHVQEAWASSVLRDGGLYVISGLKTGQVTVRPLLEDSRFENGPYQGQRILEVSKVVRSFDLSFDGRKVVFAWLSRSSPRSLKIVRVNVDGTDLRQLTVGDFDDLDPGFRSRSRSQIHRRASHQRCQ